MPIYYDRTTKYFCLSIIFKVKFEYFYTYTPVPIYTLSLSTNENIFLSVLQYMIKREKIFIRHKIKTIYGRNNNGRGFGFVPTNRYANLTQLQIWILVSRGSIISWICNLLASRRIDIEIYICIRIFCFC